MSYYGMPRNPLIARLSSPPSQQGSDLQAPGTAEWLWLWTAIQRQFIFISLITGIGVIGAGLVLVSLPKRYEASAVIKLRMPSTSASRPTGSVEGPNESENQYVDTQVQLLSSRPLTESLIDRLGRDRVVQQIRSAPFAAIPLMSSLVKEFSDLWRDFSDRLSSSLSGSSNDPGEDGNEEFEKQILIEALQSALDVERVGRTSLLRISFVDQDPSWAAHIANSYAEEYTSYLRQERSHFLQSSQRKIRTSIESINTNILETTSELHELRVDSKFFFAQGSDANRQAMSDLNFEISSARNAIKQAKSLLARNGFANEGGNNAEGSTGGLRAKLRQFESNLETLLARRKTEVLIAQKEHEVGVLREAQASLLRQLAYVDGELGDISTGIDVVSRANAPIWPLGPRKLYLLIAACAAAGLAGLGCGLAREILRKTLVSEREVASASGLACIASFPPLGPTSFKCQEAKLAPSVTATEAIQPRFMGRHKGPPSRILFDRSLFRIGQWATEGSNGKGVVIAVISQDDGDGKTRTCFEIAKSAAASIGPTLLIDGDRPRKDLTKFVQEAVNEDSESREEGSEVPPFPYELECRAIEHSCSRQLLIGDQPLANFLEAARESFSVVLLDCPSLRTSADGLPLLKHADRVLVVARKKKTTGVDMQFLSEELQLSPARATAALLNDRG